MTRLKNPMIFMLRGFALMAVIGFGLLSIIATSSNTDPGVTGFADAGYDLEVEAGHFALLDGTGSNTPLGADPGDSLVTYFWDVVEEPVYPEDFPFLTSYVLENATSINPRFKPQLDGEYVVRLTVRWSNQSDFDTVSVFTHGGFVPPTVNAGPDRFVKHGSLVTLDASESQDWDWNTLLFDQMRYTWSMVDMPAGTSSNLSDTDVVNPSFVAEYKADDVSEEGRKPFPSRYQVSLHAIDNHNMASKQDLANIYVYPPEGYVYPVPVAGPDQTVLTGTPVTLDGNDSYDVDGRALAYAWQFYARPVGSNAVLTGETTASPSFTPDVDGIYVVHLETGNGERSSNDSLLVGNYGESIDRHNQDRTVVRAVSGDTADVVADAGADWVLPANTLSVPLDGSNSYDADGDPITYRWWLVDAPIGNSASINNPTDSAPDSASLLADLPGSYVVGLYVTNGDMDQTIITLTDNTAPAANAGDDRAVTVGETVQLTGSGSSDAESDPLGYSWSLVNAPGQPWQEDWPHLSEGMDSTPTFIPNLNGEYQLQLTVNDGQFSSLADPIVITASGSAVNSAPTASAGNDQTVNVGDTVFLNGGASSDPDNDTLTHNWAINIRPLNSNAVLDNSISVTPSFDADVEGSYEVQLIVNDGLVNSTPDTLTVNAIVAGACANPLNLTTVLPFAPNLGEVATNIEIDAAGPDTISASAADAPQSADVYQARIPDANNLDQAEFVMPGSTWEEISRTHTNPISDTQSPSFVVRHIANNIYYKIDLDFTGTVLFEVQIDALSGCRCGNSAVDCPL